MGAVEAGFVRCRQNETISKKINFAVINIMNLIENTRELTDKRH